MALVNIYHIGVYGFTSPHQSRIPKQTQTYDHYVRRTISPTIRSSSPLIIHKRNKISTSLQMGYNLPPSGGGGGKSDLEALIPTIVSTVLIVAFFASPLGGIFFAIFNSIFLLALLTPFVLFGGFQFWKVRDEGIDCRLQVGRCYYLFIETKYSQLTSCARHKILDILYNRRTVP